METQQQVKPEPMFAEFEKAAEFLMDPNSTNVTPSGETVYVKHIDGTQAAAFASISRLTARALGSFDYFHKDHDGKAYSFRISVPSTTSADKKSVLIKQYDVVLADAVNDSSPCVLNIIKNELKKTIH
jgi:hypothetical protein